MNTSPYFDANAKSMDSHISASLASTSQKTDNDQCKSKSYSIPCSVWCPRHLKYITLDERRKSFASHFAGLKNPSIAGLARAGFFYDNHLRRVICYSCGSFLFEEYYDIDACKFRCKERTDHFLSEDCPRAPTDLHDKYEFLKYIPKSALQ